MALKIFIIFLINFAMANSFALVSIRNTDESELVHALIKALNKKSAKIMSHIDVRSSRKDLHDAHNKFERMRLRNSKLPYGHLDVNLETEKEPIYKLLMRIRKKTPIFIKDKNGFKIQDNIAREGPASFSFSFSFPNTNSSGNPPFNWQQWVPFKPPDSNNTNPYDWQQWMPFSTKPPGSNKEEYDWQKWIPFSSKPSRDNGDSLKNSFSSFWQKMKELKNRYLDDDWTFKPNKQSKKNKHKKSKSELRTRNRSGEEHDPLAPGKVPFNIELHEETTVKPNSWLPSYPYWNYWTYDKSLYQDACKGKTIKVGEWCIRPPPH